MAIIQLTSMLGRFRSFPIYLTSEADSPRKRDFAFVWMSKKGDEEKAIKGCNGRTVQAGLATRGKEIRIINM
jgi:hypothetical protein